ncbi:MAG: glycosyltransferase family 4 protein [Propionibacteriaceae bacterium]|jgi:glycosyltransferase involved in cell wall biosynthesis
MKIALLGPIAWRTPPKHYGPWEQVTGLLADGLAKRGIDVTLFATLDSHTAAALDGVSPRGYEEDATLDGRIWEGLHVAHALARSGEFDLLHNHLDWLPLAFSKFCRTRMLTTIHGFSDRKILPAYQAADSAYVSISDADRAPELSYLATVHHGIDLSLFTFSATGGEDLVILGRIHPDKGTADAIDIARRAGRRLKIAGPIQDQLYFTEQVAPLIDDHGVRYLGSVGPAQRAELLASAAALLHPISFAEPFGLSVVESMAAGTPVVAYNRGSMPEIIDEGVTGFLVSDVNSAAAAVESAIELDRGKVRSVAERRFSADRMVDDYLAIYGALLR